MKSHFYSRFLARNWEHAPGQLRLYRFDTGRVHRSSAKTSFTSPTEFPADVEGLLSSVIETPLGNFIARCRNAVGHVVPAAMTPEEDRALVLAVFMQSERTAHAQGTGDVAWLAELLRHPAKMSEFIRGAREIGQIVGANVTKDTLYLCSTALVALPLVGLHGWLLPLTPTSFAAFVPKEAKLHSLDNILAAPGAISALSAGIAGDFLVLPPASAEEEHAVVIKRAKEARGMARELNQLLFDNNDPNLYPK